MQNTNKTKATQKVALFAVKIMKIKPIHKKTLKVYKCELFLQVFQIFLKHKFTFVNSFPSFPFCRFLFHFDFQPSKKYNFFKFLLENYLVY